MERVFGFARIPATGAPAPSATVTVYDVGTANLATIYSDNLSTPTPEANPFTAAASGYWFFYGPAGRYDIQLSAGGIPAPYTLGDVPAGPGSGAVESYLFAGVPGTTAPHAGRLAAVLDQQGGLYIDLLGWKSVLDYAFKSSVQASLGVASGTGQLRRVTDEYEGLYLADGSTWVPLLAYAFAAATKAGLPAASLAGRLRRVSDDARGLWMDTSSQWFGLSGEVVNVVEFGAVRDGSTDDAAAIQAAIDVLTSGGTVIFPKGTYAVASAIKVRDGVSLIGHGATILAKSGYTDDSLIRTFRRDDNTAANEDEIGLENLTLQSPATPPDPFYCLDLTGACNSRISRVKLTGPSPNEDGDIWTALRLSENNPGGTSSKRCKNNILSQLSGTGWRVFALVEQDTADRCTDNVLIAFEASDVRFGFDFSALTAGNPRLTLISGQLVGDGDAGSEVFDGSLPDRLILLGVEASGFTTTTGYLAPVLLNERIAIGPTGTTASTAIAQAGTTAEDFFGSVYLKVSSGTALVAGVNTFTYTLTNAGAGATVILTPVSGHPATPVSLQGSLSGATLTVTVVVSAPVTLSSDFVFRAIQIAP